MQQPLPSKKPLRKSVSPFVWLGILGLVILVAQGAWNVYQKKIESANTLARVQHEIDDMQNRKTVLSAQLERIKSPEGVEEEIRSRFQVSKEGEKVLIITDVNDSDQTSTSSKGFFENAYDKIRSVFGGN